MKIRVRCFSAIIFIILSLLIPLAGPVSASVVAYWDMADASAADGAYMPGNGSRADLDGDGGMHFDDFRISSTDLSGNGNHLTAWSSSWMRWTSDSYKGDFSMVAANNWPASSTDSSYNPDSGMNGGLGIDLETITPAAWTIEAVFKPTTFSGDNQTIVGRDGRYVGGSNSDNAALYFSTRGGDLAITFVDVTGVGHNLQVPSGMSVDTWYHIAAVSDGSWLRLYVDDTEIGSLDMRGTSADTALGLGYGMWTVGRGMWADEHRDRCWGPIDAVAISDEALTPKQFITRDLVYFTESEDKTILYSNDIVYADSYEVVLLEQPAADVVVSVIPPAGLSVGNGNGQTYDLIFTPYNWDQPQAVSVTIADVQADFSAIERIQHSVQSTSEQYDGIHVRDVQVTIADDSCGIWGYLNTDYNMDCTVDFADLSKLAELWLNTNFTAELKSLAQDWLLSTLVYDETAQDSFAESEQPFFINTANVVNTVDEKVYGHFFEHIYHSANGGLWGEMVWNRSFELSGDGGSLWTVEGDDLVQSSLATDVHMLFGDTAWTDYELTLQARKDGGNEGFLIPFRAPDNDNFYWLNLGGWDNSGHSIEKEVNGGRTEVASRIPGSIATGQWYDIRIHCEGNRFQVWVDEADDNSPDPLLFDYTDNDNPYFAGNVGVGTWSTQARFRNIQVTDLAGSVLYSGLPEIQGNDISAEFWTMHGTGTGVISTDALNDEYSVEITGDGSETGLLQDDLKFIPQAYKGSLWMKGDLSAGVAVELMDGTNLLGQAILPAPTTSWAEYPFTIVSNASTDNGSLRIKLLGAGTVKIDQVSMMGQDAIDTGGYRPDLLEAVKGLRPPIIRWPGGCFASLYLWKDGIGPQHTRRKYSAYMWDDQDTNSYGTDEFLQMCELIDSEPIICINTGILDSACGAPAQWKLPQEDYVQDALDWMEYCNGDAETTTWGAVRAANGHPEPYNVVYWEIDNETWAAGSQAYIQAVQQFAPAMQAKAAELGVPIKLIAVGSGGFDQNWNQDVIDSCATLIDYISVHYYENPDNFKSGPVNYENYLRDLADYIANSDNPDMKIYNSEWNAQSIDWRTGLFAGGILNAYERQGENFTIGGPALFLRHLSATGWNNSFINFDHTGWFAAPNYIVMKLWWDHYAPNRIEMSGTDADLNVVSTITDDSKTLFIKIVNPDSTDKSLKFEVDDSFVPKSAYLEYVAPGDLYIQNTLADPTAVDVETRMVGLDGQVLRFVIPAYSAGVVTVKTDEPHKTAYLYSFFQGNGDGLHLAYSTDGKNFSALKDNTTFVTPTIGSNLMRDPSICQGPDGMFHMVWTTGWQDDGIGIAHSPDLINWSEQTYLPVMANEPYVYNCWAPEIFFDEATGEYLIFWASTLTEGSTNDHRMYYISTKDFVTFTDTALFYDPGFSCIDSFIVKDGDRYAMVVKDERDSGKNIRIAFSDDAAGPYDVPPSGPITPGGLWVEGPSMVKVANEWILYYDAYTSGYMGAQTSTDLQTWMDARDQVSFPSGTRHGTVFRATQQVLDALLAL